MKYCNGRQQNVWIIICIFGCVTSDIKAVLCNQHDKHVHLRETGDVHGEPYSDVHNGQSIIDNSDHKDVHDREVTADTKVNCDGNDDVAQIAQIAYTDATKPFIHKDGYSKEHTHNSIADVKSNLDGTNNTTIYLAGYDDQIYKLISDIQKHGIGSEILIYFYLYTNNSYRNICYLYTDKNTLRDCIAKYTHYFCVGHNKNDCICFKSLGHVQSTEKPTVQQGQKPQIKPELNKIDYNIGSIPGKYINTEPATVKLADIGNAMSDSKAYNPEKESLGAYEFILPKEKDIKFKDIYIDVLKSEKPKALAENQIIQGIDSIKNAKSTESIENKNIISNKDNVASLKPIFNKPGAYDFKKIPNGAIETDSIMKNPDDTKILTDSLNKGKNFMNRIYANGITDEETNQGNTLVDIPHVNLPGVETVLQFKPNINKEPEDITLLNKSNMQVDGSKPEVQIIPNMEIFKSENTVSRKPTTGASDIVNEIVSETSSPKIVGDKYFINSQNSPKHSNALNAIIADHAVSSVDNDNEGTVSLTPAIIPRVEINPNLEYSNAINDAESKKLDDENIILNPNPSNEMQINEMTPQINKIEMAANKLDLNTNEAEERNDKNNIMAIDDKPHIHNTDNTPTVKIQESIPNSDINFKVEPQNYVHDYNNHYPINTQPCTNMNDQLINHKQHPHFHPWNHLQYGDFYKLNQPILQISDQANKVGLFGQSPFNNMLHSIPGSIHMHYDFQGNEKHDTSPGKLSFIQNANLYSIDPVKGTPALNLLKPLPSNYKNTFSYPEAVANMKPEAYITNKKLHKDNPFINYNNNLPLTLTASDDVPLNNLRLNSLPTINRPSLTNYNSQIANDSVGTSVITLPLKSESTLPQTAFSQPFRISNSQETNKYFTVAPKIQPMAQDVTATVLPISANFNPIRPNPVFLHNVSPTLNSYYYKTSLPKAILSTATDSTYYPSTPVNTYNTFVPVAPIKNQIEALYANLSPSLYSSINIPYQSSSKPSEERQYVSDDDYVPKSKFISYLSPKEKSYSSNYPALSLSDSEPIASNPFKVKNILASSSVLPLSTLMQDKYTHSPLLSNTASYKPCSAVEASLPFKQSKTEPNLLEIGKFTYEPTPGYSDFINPLKSLEPSSNNIVLPNNIMSFTALNQPLKIPYNNAVFQNMVSYINAVPPNTISSTPDLSLLTPPSNTLDIESSMDIKNSPYIPPHSFPVDAKFYSITKPQSSISFVPNFVAAKPNQANLSPISFNGGKYSTFINTQIPTQQNLLTSKPLRAQSFEKYLASNEKLENNMSPDIFSSTNTDTYPTEDSRPLVLSPNYLTVPKYTDGNINSWVMLNYQKRPQPKICPSIAKPFDLLMTGNADSMLLKDSKSFIPYSYQPIATQTLMPTFMNSVLPTQNSISDPSSGPEQPCRFVENFATPILSNTMSPYSYIPGKKQKNVAWIPPCIQNGDPYLHINNMNNNFANSDQSPTGESVSKEVPLKYGEDYGLTSPFSSIEVPQYRLPGQVPCTETTPLHQTANIDFLNTIPEFALRSSIPLMSKLGLKRPTIWSMSNPDYTKPFEPNNKWDSVFLGYKTPKFAPYKMSNLNPSSSPPNEGPSRTSVSSSSNEMNYPFSVSNLVLPVPGFAPPSSNKCFSLQENKGLPKKQTEIPLPQEISKNSATILPFNLDTASKPSDMASIRNHIFPLHSLNSHVHVTSPWNSSPNNLNTLWPSYIPHSKDFNSKDEKLSNFIPPNSQNLTPLSSYHNAIITPTFGTADVSASSVENTPKVISPTALSIGSSVPELVSWPILNKQHLTPFNNLILQKSLDFSSFVDQIKPLSKIDGNKAYITYSNLQPLNTETPYLSSMATDTKTLSNLYPSSYPQGTKSNSISLPYELPSLSSSMNFPCSPSLSYSSQKPTFTTLSSKGYPYSSLLWKTPSSNQKPELISHFTDTDSIPRFYASSLPQSTRPNFESETPSNSQLNSNYNPDLSISTYLPNPYSKIKETDLNIYQNPVSNTLGYYKYGNTYKNEQITPRVLENLSLYLETSAINEKMQQPNNNAMNQINNDLSSYMKQRHVISNNLKGNLINIPLHNMGIIQYEPKLCKVSYMKTNNPDIYLKIWPAAFTIVKPHIAFEIDKFNAVNFCPVVKIQNSQYTNQEILNVVENFVKTFYGEPIIVKTVDSQKSYAVVDNIDESCIKNGKVYILWANVCDCGCDRIGCHCSS